MRSWRRAALVLVFQAACAGEEPAAPTAALGPCPAGEPVSGTPALEPELVVSGLLSPIDVQAAPGDRSRLFIVEQAGRIRIAKGTSLLGTPFLDIAGRVRSGGERGLLGLAFHPQYAGNGRLFVNYTDRSGDTQIAEFRVTSDPDRADPGSERLLLFVAQPFSNHNGGGLAFGNDGLLYIGLGDGGSAGDPFRNGQSLATPLGKLLRIDVDRGSPFAVPPDNPFVSMPGAFPAIWAYGLRNPWRFAFDRATGDLVIGDVGQNAFEEIDLGLASRRGGENYGWNVTEGRHCFSPPTGCNIAGLTLPVYEYGHGEGCSVTGGVVYRGCRMPGLQGTYFFGDYCTGFIRSIRLSGGVATSLTEVLRPGRFAISSFGVDADGEVHVADYAGSVYRLVPAR